MAFFATRPMSMMTPMKLMRLSVPRVTSSASTTPISDSGSDSITGSGAVNEPNCITSTRYITPMPMMQRGEHFREQLLLIARRAAQLDAEAGREVDGLGDLQRVLRDFAATAVLHVGRHGDRALAVEVLDLRRTLVHA